MSDETIVEIDASTATIEKRNIAFNAMVGDDISKFLLSIADFAAFGVENPKADPVGSVSAVSSSLERLIREKAKKNDLSGTTRLEAF